MVFITLVHPIRRNRGSGRLEFRRPRKTTARSGLYTSHEEARPSCRSWYDPEIGSSDDGLLPHGYFYNPPHLRLGYSTSCEPWYWAPSSRRPASVQYGRIKRFSYKRQTTLTRRSDPDHLKPEYPPVPLYNEPLPRLGGRGFPSHGSRRALSPRSRLPRSSIRYCTPALRDSSPDESTREAEDQLLALAIHENARDNARSRYPTVSSVDDDAQLARALDESLVTMQSDRQSRSPSRSYAQSNPAFRHRLTSPKRYSPSPPMPYAESISDSEDERPSTLRRRSASRQPRSVLRSGPTPGSRSSSAATRHVTFTSESERPSKPPSYRVYVDRLRDLDEDPETTDHIYHRIDAIVFSRFPKATAIKLAKEAPQPDGTHDMVLTVLRDGVDIWEVVARDVSGPVDGLCEILRKLEAGQ